MVNDKLSPLHIANGVAIAVKLGTLCTVIATSLLFVLPQVLIAEYRISLPLSAKSTINGALNTTKVFVPTPVSISHPSSVNGVPFVVIVGVFRVKFEPEHTALGELIALIDGALFTVIVTLLLSVVPQMLVA